MTAGFIDQQWQRHRWRVVTAAVAAGLLVSLGLLIGLVHVPFVRARVLAYAVSSLRDAGLDVEVGRLDYNLFTLRVGLADVTVAAEGSDTPFFSADAVRVDLPWGVVTGSLALQALEVDRPRIAIVRQEDGSLNLPEFAAEEQQPAAEPIGPVRIDRLVIGDLEARYADGTVPLSVDGRGVTLDLDRPADGRLAGRLSMSDGIVFKTTDRETRISTFEGGLAFDGTSLFVDAMTLEAPEARLRLDGTVGLLDTEQRADLRYEGRLDLARLAPWVALDPAPSGFVSFSGTAQGPLAAPEVSLAAASDGVVWSTLGSLSLDARAAMAGSTVMLESFRATLAGGEISGDGRLQLDENGSSSVRLRLENVNVGTLSTLAPDLPVTLATVAGGDLSLEWTGQDVASAQGKLALRLRAPPTRSGLTLAGRLDLEVAGGAWSLSLDQQLADAIALRGDARGRLVADDLAASSLDGRVTLQAASLQDTLRRLGAAGLAIDAQTADRLRGALTANVDLGGTFQSPVARGTLDATGLWLDELGPGRARAEFDASSSRVTVAALSLDIGPNTLSGNLVIGLDADTLRGAVTGSLPELRLLAASLPAEWRPEGSARFDAELGGSLDNPTIRLALASRDVQVAGQTIRTVRANLQFANRIAVIEELELTQDAGRLTAKGRYELASERYAFTAAGDGFAITPLSTASVAVPPGGGAAFPEAGAAPPIPLNARFDVRLTGEGTLASPQASGFVQFTHLNWDRYQLGAARADVVLERGDARVTLGVPSVNATLEATVALGDPRAFSFEAAVTDARLSELIRPSGPAGVDSPDAPPVIAPADLAGAVSLRAKGSGSLDAVSDATVNLDLDLVDVAINDAPVRLVRPARLRYAAGAVIADDLELRVGSSTLTARGALGTTAGTSEGLAIQLTGTLADFLPFARLAPAAEAFEAAGAIDLQVRATGSLELPDLTADFAVSGASFTDGTLPPVSGVTLRATYANGLLDLRELGAAWQGATIAASGQVPAMLFGDALPERYRASLPDQGRTARLTATVSAITPAMLAPFVDEETLAQIAGRIDASIAAETDTLDLDGVRADLTLTRANLELARIPISQASPTRMRLANGRLDVTEWNWAGAGNRLEVAGGVDLDDEAPRLGLRVRGLLDLRMLAAFAPEMATAGRASLDVDASGPANDPVIEGQLTIADGLIVVREPRFAITDLNGIATLTRDRLRLRDVTASANGGDVEVRGEILYPDFVFSGGTIAVSGRGLAFELPEGLRTEVNADLALVLSETAPQLTGRVTVLRGSYREPVSLAALLVTNVQVITAAAEPAEPGFVDRIQLNISVVSEEDLRIDNNYARLDLGANLKVIGTVGQPALAGRLTLLEGGEVYLGGQTYEVVRGTVDFTDATRIEPNIDLALETRVQQYDITLQVSGTPETLEASLSSPGVSQEDVISLLLTGQVAGPNTPPQTEVARGQLVMLLSGELLGFAGRAVGLDSVQLSRGLGGAASDFDLLGTSSDPGQRLTLTKSLSRDVDIVYSQSLRETGAITWIAIYRPFRNVEVRGTTEDDSTRAYEFRHELAFGGRAPRASRDRRQAESPRVSAVRLTGTPGFAETELRGRLRLTEGSRFDFGRWQGDEDRLAAFYHERDYLEAQIRARRRIEQDGAGVALEYEIERGPRTTLTVDGFMPPERLVTDMRVAWSRAVFDGFLLEDLEAMARRTLTEQAYLQATVKASVTSPPEAETKQIVVAIEPGTQYDTRRITFSGNQRVGTGVLELLAESGNLAVDAWLTPADLEDALERYYRSVGSLAADVTVDAPVFQGRSATLSVRVDEGPVFRVESVTVQGTAAKSEAEVRETFGIRTDAPYDPAALEPARREVEVSYLRDGFNNARVTVTTLVDIERPQVDVAVTVNEGRQQVLEGVDVRGAEVTSRGTIDRAVNLTPGQPANLTDAYRAQKRLYDTGAFQSANVTIEPVEGAQTSEGNTEFVRASVDLQELPRYRFRYGVRLTDDVGPVEADRRVRPGLVVDLLRRNLFGRAVTTGVAGQLEADRRLARGIVSLPQMFSLPVTTSLFLTAAREDFEANTLIEDKTELFVEQKFRPAAEMSVSYGYNFARSHVFETEEPLPDSPFPRFDVVVKIARLSGVYLWDTRDDPANARRGWFHASGLEYGPEALGSQIRFIKYLAQQYHFQPVGESVVLASGFTLGVARAFDQDLLPSERFRAGGANTVRGFAQDGLGPQSVLGPSGGGAQLVFNQEVRFPLVGWVRGVGFLDAGNVFTNASDLSFTNLEAGAGAGLRIESPFALIRVDFGVPLTRRQQEPSGRWYFGLGHTF